MKRALTVSEKVGKEQRVVQPSRVEFPEQREHGEQQGLARGGVVVELFPRAQRLFDDVEAGGDDRVSHFRARDSGMVEQHRFDAGLVGALGC